MVRGLTVGITHTQVEYPIEITIDQMPHKAHNPKVIVDGVSLAYNVVSPFGQHPNNFALGGNYKLYSKKALEFIATLQTAGFEIVIVLPFADGTPTSVPKDISEARWLKKANDKLHRIQRLRNVVEKGVVKNLMEVLPPMIISEIAETATSHKVEVIYTRNNVTRFCAKYVAEGKADAVIAQNSDYLIFKDVNYIPIDSININVEKKLAFEFLNIDIAAKLLQLNDPERMFELSVLLGNIYTEPFVVSKYNIPTLLHLKLNSKYQDTLVVNLVEFLNNEEFESILTTSPTKETIAADEDFKKAIEDSRKFYDIDTPLEEEGTSEFVEKATKGEVPDWTPCIAEGGDFWYEPIVDDYANPIKTDKITQPLRKILYAILKRPSVVEHIPGADAIETVEVKAEEGFPDYAKLQSLKKRKGGLQKIKDAFNNIAHCCFPVDYKLPKDDPISTLDEPIQTCAYALRYLISQCFTNNQIPRTMLPETAPQDLKDAKVVGAPPLDLYEIKSLAITSIVLCLNLGSKFSGPVLKPKLRRMKVSALYQTTLQHLIWLQQLLGIKSPNSKPHRLFDGDIFSTIYDASGEIASEKFALYFEDPEKVMKLESTLLKEFMDIVLKPFPADLFEAFATVPRSFNYSNVQETDDEPVKEVEVVKSSFSVLLDDSDDEGSVAAPPPVVSTPPPPPPPAKKQQTKKNNKKKDDDDDDMEAFLLAQAQKNSDVPKAAPKVSSKPQPKKKTYVRKVHGSLNQNITKDFAKESKGEVKRQLKQQGFDYN